VSYDVGEFEYCPIRVGSELKVETWEPKRRIQKKIVRYLYPYFNNFCSDHYSAFEPTVGNAVAAARLRVLNIVPAPDQDAISALAYTCRNKASRLGSRLGEPWSDDKLLSWIQSLPAKKRNRYREAFDSLKAKPFCRLDANIKCFLKMELSKITEGKIYKPRMIQYRSARYLVHVARFLKPIEHAIYNSRNIFTDKGCEVAKQMNAKRRAAVLGHLVSQVNNPFLISIDASSYDAHINTSLLKLESDFYWSMTRAAGWSFGDSRILAEALKYQRDNRVSGLFPDGKISYRVLGNRMSGDLNTSCGNVVIMCCVLSWAMDDFVGRSNWGMLDDGDDCVVVASRHRIGPSFETDIVSRFLSVGITLRVEQCTPIDCLEIIEFCQSHPVRVGSCFTMVRNPRKCIATTLAGFRWHVNEEDLRKYLWMVGMGDGFTHLGVPVLQSFYRWCLKCGIKPTDKLIEVYVGDQYRFQGHFNTVEPQWVAIHPDSRVSFALAFGIDVLEQVYYEQIFDNLPLDGFTYI
jgi:hypothetical protein